MNRPKHIVVHHTGGTDANPLADTSHHTFGVVDNWHKKLWNFRSSLGHYIGYHYFIDKTGKVTQGRADWDEGAHTRGYNSVTLGVCLAGNFDATKPSKEQEEALRELLLRLMNKHNITLENCVPHRKFANKTCYGRNLPDNWLQKLVGAPKDAVCKLSLFTTKQIIDELLARFRR